MCSISVCPKNGIAACCLGFVGDTRGGGGGGGGTEKGFDTWPMDYGGNYCVPKTGKHNDVFPCELS